MARSTLMVNTMPFWVLVGAHFLLGEHMTLRKWAGLALAFAGVVLVFSDKLSLPGPEAITGDIMSLGAGVLWAATTLVIKKSRLAATSAEKLLLYQLAVSAAMALPLLLFAGPALREFSRAGLRRSAVPGCLCRRLHLYSVVLADAALSRRRAVELRLPDAGLRRSVRRHSARRTAERPDLCWLSV